MHIIGIEADGLGYNNQMRGVVMQGAKRWKYGQKVPISRQALLKAPDGTILHPKNFKTQSSFEKAVNETINVYLRE